MVKQLTAEEAEQLVANGNVVIADVRDLDSYQEGHIAKAIHLSMPLLQEFCEQQDPNQPILVYCYHGISSQSVVQHLIEQGFSEVYSLTGGFEAWKAYHAANE